MFSDISREEYFEALERTAEEVLWEAGVPAGSVDAFDLADRLGVAVLRDDHLPRRGQFVRLAAGSGVGTQATVLLGREPRGERQQWALAHELGEGVAHRVFSELGIDPEHVRVGSREQVASQLAARLLLPLRPFRKVGTACDWDLMELKAAFPTASHELIARRMLDLRNPIVVTVVDQESITWRRANVPGVPNQMLGEEESCWRECHTLAMPRHIDTHTEPIGTATIHCWPVHEADWQREIMLVRLDEAA